MDTVIEQRVLQGRAKRRDSALVAIPPSLHPQIVSTLKTVYGNGVLAVTNSKINKDGQIEGVFVGRSRPTEPARAYSYGIDLVKQDVRFKRVARKDSEEEETCGCKKCAGSRTDADDLAKLERNASGEVKYQGRWWKPNEPVSSTSEGKKKMVLAVKDGKVKIVHFGATGYGNNYSESARSSYMARSAGIKDKNGDATKDDRHSPNYWARKVLWAGKGGDVTKPDRKDKDNPCWEGYEQVGVKRKGGRIVPNCVPIKK
jgi:hypothetical protein